MIAKVFIQDGLYTAAANANLIVANQPILAALRAASGYLLNAKIDLETGATKKAAIATIERGLRVVETALTSA